VWIGTLGGSNGRDGRLLGGESGHDGQGLASSCAAGIRVYNPRENGHVDRRRGVERNSASPMPTRRRVLALMGRTIDNIKGVRGSAKKGPREL